MNNSAITYKHTVSENESVYIVESVNRYYAYAQGDMGAQLYQSRITWTLVHERDGEQDFVNTCNSTDDSYKQIHDFASVYIDDFIESATDDECLDDYSPHTLGKCEGRVEYRESLTATGSSFPRCDHHWDMRLEMQEQINGRYPDLQPADFDPAYAGESWDADY